MLQTVWRVLLLFLLGISTGAVSAQESTPMKTGDQQMTFESTWDGTTQPYRLFVPEKLPAGPAPLVVVLHGRGVDHNAWFDLTPVKAAGERHGAILAAPLGRGSYWYRGAAEQDVLDIVSNLRELYDIDSTRIYLIGHSMGGWGTAWIAARNPDLFAACAPMSGWAPEDLLINTRHTPMFLIHDADDPIVTVINSRFSAAKLSELGVSHRYLETTGYGHSSKLIGDNLDRIFAWLYEHKRDPRPAHVSLAARHPVKGTAFWLRMLDNNNYPEAASIEADADNERGLTIRTNGVGRFAVHLDELPVEQETLAVQIDGGTSQTVERKGWLICRRGGNDWSIRVSLDAPEAPEVREVPLPAELNLAGAAPEALTAAFAEILAADVGADLALFRYDMFRDQGWPMDMVRLSELYVYPVEDLGIFEADGERVKKVLAEDKDLVLAPASAAVEGDKLYRVIAPMDYAKKFSDGVELLPQTVPVMLYELLAPPPRD